MPISFSGIRFMAAENAGKQLHALFLTGYYHTIIQQNSLSF
jgi:hypothetical protein